MRGAGGRGTAGSEEVRPGWGNGPQEGSAPMPDALVAEPESPGVWYHRGGILCPGC